MARVALQWFLALITLSGLACKAKDEAPASPPSAPPAAPAAPAAAEAPLQAVNHAAVQCGECHAPILADWLTSMHAHSTREADPLYRIMTDKAHAAMGDKALKGCAGCHYPDGVDKLNLEGPTTHPDGHAVEGVSCTVCHSVPEGHPDVRWPGGESVVFRRQREGQSGAEGLCLSCHAEMKNPEGHDVCTTGAEIEGYKGQETCVDCHMEKVPGAPWKDAPAAEHRSHRFPGGRDAEMLRRAAKLELALESGPAEGERRVAVTLRADRIGHAFATGTPMRSVFVRVQALGADGAVLWQNAPTNPLAEAPEALFARVFADAEGNRPVPPFMAKGPAQDTRLEPHGQRTWSYPLPPNAAKVTAQVEYRLAPPPMLQAAGLPTEPTIAATAELTVP